MIPSVHDQSGQVTPEGLLRADDHGLRDFWRADRPPSADYSTRAMVDLQSCAKSTRLRQP
jgi:hypothetical protein